MRVSVFLFLLGLLVVPANGQTIWSRPYEPNQLAVEVILPDSPDEASALSGATFLTGTVSFTDNVQFAAELPVARYVPTANGGTSTTALGNPYLGFDFSSTNLPILVQVGARLPLAPSNAAARIGQIADAGRLPAFRAEEFGLSTLLNGRLSLGGTSSLRLRAGAEYASRPRSGGRSQNVRLLYAAQLWKEGERLITGLSFSGRANLSEARDTEQHATISIMGNWRRVQPGLLTGINVGDLLNQGSFTPFVGLTLSVTYLRN
jgi:hypothetical protein